MFDLTVSSAWLEARGNGLNLCGGSAVDTGGKYVRLSDFTVNKNTYATWSVFLSIRNAGPGKCNISQDPVWISVYYDDVYRNDQQLRASETPHGDGIIGPGEEATKEMPWNGSYSDGIHKLKVILNWDEGKQKPLILKETNYGNNERTVTLTMTPCSK